MAALINVQSKAQVKIVQLTVLLEKYVLTLYVTVWSYNDPEKEAF